MPGDGTDDRMALRAASAHRLANARCVRTSGSYLQRVALRPLLRQVRLQSTPYHRLPRRFGRISKLQQRQIRSIRCGTPTLSGLSVQLEQLRTRCGIQ